MENNHYPYSFYKKGTFQSAFFRFSLVFYFILNSHFLLAAPALASQTTHACALSLQQSTHNIQTVTIDHVYDGDTVRLTDGRKVRIIGINTPELGTNSNDSTPRRSEPYAKQAKHYLQKLVQTSKSVWLRYGVQKKDHYGRILAHLFLKDRRNIAALLLKNGFARSLHVPPNDWQFHCYAKLDRQAQQLKIGLWSDAFFRTRNTNLLKPTKAYDVQFMQVNGTVSRVANDNKTLWINLGSRFAIRINKSNLKHFNNINFEDLMGTKITARGYVVYYPKPSQFRMLVRHPTALTFINNSNNLNSK